MSELSMVRYYEPGDLPEFKNGDDISVHPHLVRSLGIRRENDFDRMCDKIIVSWRYGDLSHMNRSGIMFEKEFAGMFLPENEPTPGLDLLAEIIRRINRDL